MGRLSIPRMAVEVLRLETVALDPHMHVLDRIEAWCELIELYHRDSEPNKMMVCAKEIEALCHDEKEAGW